MNTMNNVLPNEWKAMITQLCTELKSQFPRLNVRCGELTLQVRSGGDSLGMAGTLDIRSAPGNHRKYIASLRVDSGPALLGDVRTVRAHLADATQVCDALDYLYRATESVALWLTDCPCGHCSGTGKQRGDVDCNNCSGTGKLNETLKDGHCIECGNISGEPHNGPERRLSSEDGIKRVWACPKCDREEPNDDTDTVEPA